MKTLLVLPLLAITLSAEEKVDLAVIQRIKTEAFQNSQVMDHLFWITDVYGPRLTGSPGFTAAANWVVKRLKAYGIDDAATQPWAKFGRSWRLTKFSISIQDPEYAPLIGFPLAWSADTKGPVMAEPVLAPLKITDNLDGKKTGGAAKVLSGTEGQAEGQDRVAREAAGCDAGDDRSGLAVFRRRPG
jgi:carboxypeptidase Q